MCTFLYRDPTFTLIYNGVQNARVHCNVRVRFSIVFLWECEWASRTNIHIHSAIKVIRNLCHMISPFSMKHHKVPSLNLYRLFPRDEVHLHFFFLLTCTLNDTVSSSATSALFCFLFWRGTGGHQDSPPKLVPQLSCFYDYSSFNNNPSISKKKKRKPATACLFHQCCGVYSRCGCIRLWN